MPRHPQRFDEVAALVAGAGLTLARRSGWADDSLEGPREDLVRGVGHIALAGALSFLLVSFFIVGYLAEAALTFRPPGLGGVRFEWDQPNLATVLVPSRSPAGHSGYIGLSLFLLAERVRPRSCVSTRPTPRRFPLLE